MKLRWVAAILGLWAELGASSLWVAGAEVVRLAEWESPADLIAAGGAGGDLFELTARVAWAPGASGSLLVRVALPGGRLETQPLRVEPGDAPRTITALVPAASVRNLRPDAVSVRVSVVDPRSNAEVSNVLVARIDDFPHPQIEASGVVSGPFGWGRPLSGPPGAGRLLSRAGPDGFRFVRIPHTDGNPGVFLATTEASNAQVTRRLTGHDPRAGRSDEFTLEDPAQPAIGLTPARADAYVGALTKSDPSGVIYRLPTVAEWSLGARAGVPSAFWWGDAPTHPSGANFLGPEPGLSGDSTARGTSGFEANPWGLLHTFGNVAEWARDSSGGFARMGGHFRTEPASPLPSVPIADGASTGPDPYVGVRPAFDLDPRAGAALVRKAFGADARLASIQVAWDPDRATATLQGKLPDASLRRLADSRLGALWFLEAVENRVETPTLAAGQLALLGRVAGRVRRITPLGRWFYEVPVEVRWAEPLPVSGSSWWVNLYLPGGAHVSHPLVEVEPNRSRRVLVLIDQARMSAAGLPVDAPVTAALSLGGEAASSNDPRVVSNVVALRWSVR